MSESFIAGFTPPLDDGGPVWWIIFSQDKLLVSQDDPPRLPQAAPAAALGLTPALGHYLGLWQGRPCYAAQLAEETPPPAGHDWHGLYGLALGWPEALTALGGRAKQILAWEKHNRFCGACAAPMQGDPRERVRRCPSCGLVAYPRVSRR